MRERRSQYYHECKTALKTMFIGNKNKSDYLFCDECKVVTSIDESYKLYKTNSNDRILFCIKNNDIIVLTSEDKLNYERQ